MILAPNAEQLMRKSSDRTCLRDDSFNSVSFVFGSTQRHSATTNHSIAPREYIYIYKKLKNHQHQNVSKYGQEMSTSHTIEII